MRSPAVQLKRAARFRTGTWRETAAGGLALSSALAWLNCDVETRIRHHAHTIFIGRVNELGPGSGRKGLLHFDRQFVTTP